uniref:Uncharacterized protein n=1 Tax=Panagrolaimus sp. PS1159 TaxID=55785 RepID=A0AC35GDS5_9BILA
MEKEYLTYSKNDHNELQVTPEYLQEFPERGLRLFGSRLPRCDQTLVKIIESCKLQTFEVGSIFKGSQRKFRIEKCIGSRTYRVKDVGTKARFFLKLEAIGMPKAAPSLKVSLKVLFL